VFLETPRSLAICAFGTRSLRCSRRINAQSSKVITSPSWVGAHSSTVTSAQFSSVIDTSTSSPSRPRHSTSAGAASSRTSTATDGSTGRKGDPLYGIRNLLHAGTEHLTDRQLARITRALDADERHDEVTLAWHCAQQVRAVYHAPTPAAGKALAEKVVASLPSCPVPEIARLGKTLRRWKAAFLAYFDTDGASNGGTEAICESAGQDGVGRAAPGVTLEAIDPLSRCLPVELSVRCARPAPSGPLR